MINFFLRYAGDINHLRGRLPCLACCLSSQSLMWKNVHKVLYFSLVFTDDGVALKTPLGEDLSASKAPSFYPFLFLFKSELSSELLAFLWFRRNAGWAQFLLVS